MKSKLLLLVKSSALILVFIIASTGTGQCGPVTVEYWNIKAGYEKPVDITNPKFLGFFIPVFGQTYSVCVDGDCVDYDLKHYSGLTGKRYEQGKHDGWDIVGWFDTDCGLHLFESGTYTAQLFRDGKFQSIVGGDTDATVRFDAGHGGSPTHGDYYAHVNPNKAIKDADFRQAFKAGDDIGKIHGNHLHFEVLDYKTKKSIDPIQFWQKGSKTCAKCPVPEPATILLFILGLVSLVGIARKKKK